MSKLRTIGLIALAALLLAVPAGVVLGEQQVAEQGDIPEVTPYPPMPPTIDPSDWDEAKWAEVRAQGMAEAKVPANDVGIAAISSGVQPPYRSGLNAHGRAWTRAHHEPGVLTQVVVDVALWWWDGASWIRVGIGFDSETEPCWRGLITARGLAISFNASTGLYAVTSRHRVYVDGVRIYHRQRESQHVWLTFP